MQVVQRKSNICNSACSNIHFKYKFKHLTQFQPGKKNLGPVFKFHCWNVTQDIGQAQQNIAPINVAPLAHPLNCVPYGQNI